MSAPRQHQDQDQSPLSFQPDGQSCAVEAACSAERAPPKVPLNTALHAQLLQTQGARPSSYASAMRALQRLRHQYAD